MAYFGVRGRVLDEEGRGIARALVRIRDAQPLVGDLPLGEALTDANGGFEVPFDPADYRLPFRPKPSLAYDVYDRAGIRCALRAGPVEAEGEPIADAPPLVVPRREIEGWLVTTTPGKPREVLRGSSVDLLVDGESIFRAVAEAAGRAKHRLHIHQLLWKPHFIATFDADGNGTTLVEHVLAAARRGVEVRVLLNQNAVFPDDVDEMRADLEQGMDGRVEVRGLPSSPEVLHAKGVIVDDEDALVIGPPFEPRYWDTTEHLLDEPRRGYDAPLHDVALRLRGPAGRACASFFAQLWNAAEPSPGREREPIEPLPPQQGPAGSVALQAVRTMPSDRFTEAGALEIRESYERALANAERYAFLETQYFTSDRIARALREALRDNRKLEVILLINEHMDIPLRHYDRFQEMRLDELGFPDHPRLGVFSLWSFGRREERLVARPMYVHTKLAFVDDVWATIGSANLDGYSLDSADEFGLEGVRSIEWNATLLDGIEGEPRSGAVRAARETLWRVEAGVRGAFPDEPGEGWLAWWRARAEANLRALGQDEAPPHGFVLPHRADVPRNVEKLPLAPSLLTKIERPLGGAPRNPSKPL